MAANCTMVGLSVGWVVNSPSRACESISKYESIEILKGLCLFRVVERVGKNHGGEGEVTVVELDQKTKGQL